MSFPSLPNKSNKFMSKAAANLELGRLLRREVCNRLDIGRVLHNLQRVCKQPEDYLDIIHAHDLSRSKARYYIRCYQRLFAASTCFNKFSTGAVRFLCNVTVSQTVANAAVAIVKQSSVKRFTQPDAIRLYNKMNPASKVNNKASGKKRGLTWRIVKTPMATGVEVKLDFKNLAMRKFLSKAIKLKADLKMEMASGKGIKSMVRLTITKKGKQIDQIVY